jgi:hypothetical protein
MNSQKIPGRKYQSFESRVRYPPSANRRHLVGNPVSSIVAGQASATSEG